MVKHTQTIRRQQPANCLSVYDHFVGLKLKELKNVEAYLRPYETSMMKFFCENS